MKTVRLTAAQALVRFLAAQMTEVDGKKTPIFAGVWAIFGHGNVAAIGEALYAERERLPTLRGHNEQSMALAAVAFAKASGRRRMMACTSSIGPGATNMVTAAAVAHVDRLPVLFLPGDVFANRRPDPVLQQVEDFGDGTASANDCFRPVSRYFDRITRPEQVINAAQRAMAVLTDPAECGPVTLALCQDVQAEAFDYPPTFLEERMWVIRRVRPDETELAAAVAALRAARKPLIIAGGGVLYSGASRTLTAFAEALDVPVAETQAGKSSTAASHPLSVGSIGVTGTSAANALAEEADLILAVGTRLQDFTTGSWSLFKNPARRFIALNVQVFDALKHRALPLVADAKAGLEELSANLAGWRSDKGWREAADKSRAAWLDAAARFTGRTNVVPPSDAQVIGAVARQSTADTVVVNASGGLPGELHKHWRAERPFGYHLEYGYSCMGYEIPAGIGVKMALPDRDVVVLVGDGSYLMMNSELATSVLLGQKLTIVVLDNHGYGCITRLQVATGGERFNNLFEDTKHVAIPHIDFRAHAESLGAIAEKVTTIDELEAALGRARKNDRTTVIVIDTDPFVVTDAGGHWWDVAVPEVSARPTVNAARRDYEDALPEQRLGD
jgi:3D-(3,5/4)-trihydroxycyclohexane-1,2-dione acylhydrolase (decyclizing)